MEFGRNQGNSRNFGQIQGIQWNSVGFCMALSMNSVGIPGGDFGATPGFQENLEFGAVSGDLGPQKAFAQIAILSYFSPILRVAVFPILCLEGPTRKPRHASVFSTYSDTQAAPRIPLCTKVLRHFFDTRVLKTHRHAVYQCSSPVLLFLGVFLFPCCFSFSCWELPSSFTVFSAYFPGFFRVREEAPWCFLKILFGSFEKTKEKRTRKKPLALFRRNNILKC